MDVFHQCPLHVLESVVQLPHLVLVLALRQRHIEMPAGNLPGNSCKPRQWSGYMADNPSARDSQHYQPDADNRHHPELYFVQTREHFLPRADRCHRPPRFDGRIKDVGQRVVILQHLHAPQSRNHVSPDAPHR